ncbi:cyclic GMP-AMP synthase-like [Anneissia japonica]|uniref:cyclic GMP-AMP synthase-like n=1 Tax=Anneissia japonica TaxID=1529436 RepID=UPI0014256446|nr:cyclic GMP-AMP synthase-like [Anneissia japonica]
MAKFSNVCILLLGFTIIMNFSSVLVAGLCVVAVVTCACEVWSFLAHYMKKKPQEMKNFIINTVIKLRRNRYESVLSNNDINYTRYDGVRSKITGAHIYAVGSYAETMPMSVCRDADRMVIYEQFPLVVRNQQRGNCLIAKENSHEPLYVLLKVLDHMGLDEECRSLINNDGYLESEGFLDFYIRRLMIEAHTDTPTIHGPSASFPGTTTFVDKGTGREFEVTVEFDMVFCLKCESWPGNCFDYFTRKRLNDWPSRGLLESIHGLPFHVVPIGHHLSSTKNIEWRYSFSIVEKQLILGMPEPYVKCMIVLKALRNNYIKYSDSEKPTPFCSYYIKTACFWMCESVPHDTYKNTVLISKVLDWLIDSYHKGKMRHYFIPQQNLIRHLSVKCRDDVRAKLTEVKKNLRLMVMTPTETELFQEWWNCN